VLTTSACASRTPRAWAADECLHTWTGKTFYRRVYVPPELFTARVARAEHRRSQRFREAFVNIKLARGQVYELDSSADAQADITGTVLTADKPVAVLSGDEATPRVAADSSVKNEHTEQGFIRLPPTDTWGASFAAVSAADHPVPTACVICGSTSMTAPAMDSAAGHFAPSRTGTNEAAGLLREDQPLRRDMIRQPHLPIPFVERDALGGGAAGADSQDVHIPPLTCPDDAGRIRVRR
jgi:IgGFc binding protein